jgi:spermidine/putrescine transport system ATP-binding protein
MAQVNKLMVDRNLDLECRNVVKRFGAFTAVNGISFEIAKGSFFSILGPSGCGKTTLLRMLAGFADPDEGDILIKGASVLRTPPNRRPVNLVFQHLALFPMMTVAENIAYGLKRRGTPRAEIERSVKSILQRIGLPDAGPKRIEALSGGQKQRIAIARCMVLDPAVLLLDEPLGALDLKLREHMKVELKLLQQQFGTTFIYITHDQSEALVMSDQVAVMNAGRFEQVGSPQALYHRPASAFVAGFVGDSNRLSGKVAGIDAREINVVTDGGLSVVMLAEPEKRLAVGDRVELFVRPETIEVAAPSLDDPATLAASVEAVLFNGANSRLLLRLTSGESMSAALPATGDTSWIARGATATIRLAPQHCLCFPASPR